MKLLVSVRNVAEARQALDGGAHVIDVKEPLRGSLGASTPQQLAEVRCGIASQVPLSAALGELLDNRPAGLLAALEGYSFAKVGLSRCANHGAWAQCWEDLLSQFPRGVQTVAVVYADYTAAAAPQPERIIHIARQLAIGYLLMDTFDKQHGGLFDHLSPCEVTDLLSAARAAGMVVALAGSVTPQILSQVSECAPDLVAVRGGVCRGGRTGQIDASLVRQFSEQLSTPPPGFALSAPFDFVDSAANRP